MNLSEKIIAYAGEIGIEVTGIIDSNPLADLKTFLEEQQAQDFYTPFVKSPVSERVNPGLSLPGCKTVICLALPYYLPAGPATANNGPYGQVARIARFRDYHLLLRDKAQQIISFLSGISSRSFRHLISIDDGPLAERAFAGKTRGINGANTFFISKKYGSWVALGLIMLDIPLPLWPDPPANSERCLNCGLCRDNCPTGALSSPYRLNARKCLSFISQAKGIVSDRYREALGTRLYGCDTCQEVCPLNKDAAVSPVKEVANPVLPDNIPLIPLLNINKKVFSDTIGNTSAGWRGHQTLLRNAVIALGNSNNSAAVTPLADFIYNDPRPLIRLHAAWSLGKLDGTEAKQALEKSLRHENDEQVRLEINSALGK